MSELLLRGEVLAAELLFRARLAHRTLLQQHDRANGDLSHNSSSLGPVHPILNQYNRLDARMMFARQELPMRAQRAASMPPGVRYQPSYVQPLVVMVAGQHRSGTTWLYNAAWLLLAELGLNVRAGGAFTTCLSWLRYVACREREILHDKHTVPCMTPVDETGAPIAPPDVIIVKDHDISPLLVETVGFLLTSRRVNSTAQCRSQRKAMYETGWEIDLRGCPNVPKSMLAYWDWKMVAENLETVYEVCLSIT